MIYRIAVTSKDKNIIDTHFGHAEEFHIYDVSEEGELFVESRNTVKYCSGLSDCADDKSDILDIISDCNAVLTKMIGYTPQKKLEKKGIVSFFMVDTVQSGLKSVFESLKKGE